MPGSQGFSRRYIVTSMVALSAIVGALLVLHTLTISDVTLLPPVALDNTSLALLALLVFLWLLPLMRSITLPGGTRIDLRDTWPATAAVRRIPPMERPKEVVGEPTTTWRLLLPGNAKVGLAGLRMAIEEKVREIAARSKFPEATLGENLYQVSRRLRSAGVMTADEENAILSVAQVCGQAVDASEIPSEVAATIADLGETVLQLLEEKLEIPE